MNEVELEKSGAVQFRAHVSSIKTAMGHWKIVLDIFEIDTPGALRAWELYQKNVQVALVPLPEEN